MKKTILMRIAGICCCCALGVSATDVPEVTAGLHGDAAQPVIRIIQLISGSAVSRRYPYALPSLCRHIAEVTSTRVDPVPLIINSFEDRELFNHAYMYINYADRADWNLSALERENLKQYLERGGFIHIDAGITAEFLRENLEFGQHHSFGEWEARPELKALFTDLFPGRSLRPLPRAHPIFRMFYQGLPDPAVLPENIRDYVVNEKWPEGTYSTVALHIQGRVAVAITPIVAMGWGKNNLGNWMTNIRFRVREGAVGLSESLQQAAYSGARFESKREDGGIDLIYCQNQALPAWVQEPGNRWRVFQYYGSTEISDFAHVFYTQLATNFLVYALTH